MIQSMMRVIEIAGAGGPEVLRYAERPIPAPGPGEVRIKTSAIGINRPDIQQRRGLYPPPSDANDLPGLDIAGTIDAIGSDVDTRTPGQTVCALTNGGGYAQYCCVPAVQTMPVPRGLTLVEAASLPEVFFTAWNNVVMLARFARSETLLIQGGSSGVGLAAIQIARRLLEGSVIVTASSEEKRRLCRDFGAAHAVDYRDPDWATKVREITGGEGVDVILDGQAGPYTQPELDLLRPDGRLVLIASHLGKSAEVNLNDIVRRRLTLTGSTLRPRPPHYKGAIASQLVERVWPLLESGEIRTHIHQVFDFEDMRSAHALMDSNAQMGKVVVRLDDERLSLF